MENSCEAKPRPKTVKEFFISGYFWKPFLAVLIGGIAGFLYYHYVGCASGTCAITSNPYMSVMMGGFLGFFIINSHCSRGKC
jgi:hypothetical protein